MDHRSQALASTLVASKKGRRATHTGNDGDEDGLEEGTTEDLAAAQVYLFSYELITLILLFSDFYYSITDRRR
jgi:hypothetical protein